MKAFKTILFFIIILFASSIQADAQSIKPSDNTIQYPNTGKEYRTYKQYATDSSPAKALSPIHHYQNSAGNTIQAPTTYDKIPKGATALCRDGTYSFSQHRSGTCSGHGGVARWL